MDLSLIPTDDLINEIIKRHDHVVLTGMKITNIKGEYISFRRWSGNRTVTLGLCKLVEQLMCQEELQSSIPIERNNDR